MFGKKFDKIFGKIFDKIFGKNQAQLGKTKTVLYLLRVFFDQYCQKFISVGDIGC